MKFIGLRHGQSTYNLQSLCNDDPTQPVNLTEVGIQQAQRAANELAGKGINKIFSSPLPRALQTAGIINEVLDIPITVEPRLADIRSGFEGKPVKDYMAAIAADPLNSKINGGESILEQYQRVSGFLDEIYHAGLDNVLLVAHEETLRVFKAWSEGLQPEEVIGLPFENCRSYLFIK
ncbi:MAG: histidine phosphatase family protein [Chromatiales bacterium]|jgi:broad specificity phosphatase PhoE